MEYLTLAARNAVEWRMVTVMVVDSPFHLLYHSPLPIGSTDRVTNNSLFAFVRVCIHRQCVFLISKFGFRLWTDHFIIACFRRRNEELPPLFRRNSDVQKADHQHQEFGIRV